MKPELKKVFSSLSIPILFGLLLVFPKFLENQFGLNFVHLGIDPKNFNSLGGIILSPFIHGDNSHLFNNLIPFVFLLWLLIFFYNKIAFKVLLINWIGVGVLVWLFARPAWHIGASGVAYSLASFLIFIGIFKRDAKLMSISFLVIFLYGSWIWGAFPDFFPDKPDISWESHLFGGLLGLTTAFIFRKKGPQPERFEWEEEEDDEESIDDYWNTPYN